MSQRCVERVIGRLVTDEAFRRRYAQDPRAALSEMVECGIELTSVEMSALTGINAETVARVADALDPRIQKIDICGD